MPYHIPVLLDETLAALDQKPGARLIDGTMGDGGHTAAFLERMDGKATVLGIDLDSKALETAKERLVSWGDCVLFAQGNYRDLEKIARANGWENATGILLDLGIRSAEIEESGLGFSFLRDEPLIMRFDGRTDEETAASLINSATQGELSDILQTYGEESFAPQISKAIVMARKRRRILRTSELVEIIRGAVPGFARHGKMHVATKTFQAIRIAVNEELASVQAAIPTAVSFLAPGGTLAVISFHSLEDRIVKTGLRRLADTGNVELLTKKPIVPSEDEIKKNPRSRSAKLRVARTRS
ncbi:16S rRNA (cytosine(1402)-N(4))-methyltransferase RsmH [Patescibacteria group bacterium]|nr:16S rRNA (cytosine(1402)-N(4))-methyltransferase RsmH [Patescibacteria group bacterium]